MFNRNLQPKQFPDLDLSLDLPAASAPSKHRDADLPEFPLAGGTFKAARRPFLANDDLTPGTFISQSTQTVMPGTASIAFRDRVDRDPVVTFHGSDEGEEGGWKADIHVGNSREGEASLTLASRSPGPRITTTTILPNEEVGPMLRSYQGLKKEDREKRDPGALG